MRSLVPLLLLAGVLVRPALAWRTAVADTPFPARPHALAVDPDGDVVAVGRAVGGAGNEDALVAKLDGGTGAELWQHTTAGSGAATDLLRAVAAGAGGIVAVGQLVNAATAGDAYLVKRAAGGGLLWEVVLDGGASLEDDALAVALDAAGDVVVGLQSTPFEALTARFTVQKRAAPDGDVEWSTQLAGDGGAARAVAIAGGVAYAAGDVGDLIVVTALDLGTGTPAWRTDVAGSPDAEDVGRAVAVGGGRVVVAGRLVAAGGTPDFAVVALDAATGGELWRVTIDGSAAGDDDADDALGVALDANGDVLAAGGITNADTDQDLIAVKLAGATGAELWRTVVNGPNDNADEAQALALDAAGDLLLAGTLRSPGTRADLFLARLANATGAERWRVTLDGTESGADSGLAVAASAGDVVGAGRLRNGQGDGFVVVKRSASGGDFPCADGTEDPGEACDDGNVAPGDGCRADCTVERCGDGIADPQDACDDGNLADGDCCSATCALETGACDDGDACTHGDACQAGTCTPAATTPCTPESSCHVAACDPTSGACQSAPKAEGALCDDANACTTLDRCFASLCTGTLPPTCSDGDPCTLDGCDPGNGCTFVPYTSFPSALCAFERDRIAEACGAGVPRPVQKRIDAARTLLDRASAGARPAKVRRAIRKAAKALEKGRRLIARQLKRDRVDAACADVLDVELADMATRARAVGAALGS